MCVSKGYKDVSLFGCQADPSESVSCEISGGWVSWFSIEESIGKSKYATIIRNYFDGPFELRDKERGIFGIGTWFRDKSNKKWGDSDLRPLRPMQNPTVLPNPPSKLLLS